MAPADAPANDIQDDELNDAEVNTEATSGDAQEAEEEKIPLSLEVDVQSTSTCTRHISVTVPRVDIDRYLDDTYGGLVDKAEIPGFRPGKAPRKLVESRFRDQVYEQVKGSLLVDSLAQIAEDKSFTPISEPEMDYKAVTIPKEGPMTFEFDIEVRPEFDLPNWKSLNLKRPVHTYTDEDVEKRAKQLLERYGKLVPHEGAAEANDYVVVNLTSRLDGRVLASREELALRIRPSLSLSDAELNEFDTLMIGASEGDKRTATVTVSNDHIKEDVRGKEVTLEFEVLDVKRLEMPELTPAFLDRFGFDDRSDLLDAVRSEMEKQVKHRQQQSLRGQISHLLLIGADWDLPPAMLRRQARREIERTVLELQSMGFDRDEIQTHINQIQRNILESTRRSLKEHFVFERIAEENAIEPSETDYADEIERIADAADESPRRVAARLEKRGQMDALRNWIVERKVVELIESHADVTDEPLELEERESQTAVDFAVAGASQDEIPEAKYADSAEKPLPGADER